MGLDNPDFLYLQRNWPYWLGMPEARARIKSCPQDFRVSEIPGFEFSDSGDHLCVQIEKTNINTRDVIDQMKKALKLKDVDVGYFGLKDKFAVTDQWFSIHAPGKTDDILERCRQLGWTSARLDDNQQQSANFHITQTRRHTRKLRIGTHHSNRFTITLKHFEGSKTLFTDRLNKIVQFGFPNYFGEQRFGNGGRNLVHAMTLFRATSNKGGRAGRKGANRKLSRTQRSLYISAARSYLFNLVLGERLTSGSWLKPESQEPLMLAGSRSFFKYSDDESTLARIEASDLHTTGPLWGLDASAALASERELLSNYSELCLGLENEGFEMNRRALRASVLEFRHSWLDKQTVEMDFYLRPGCYATSMLRELIL